MTRWMLDIPVRPFVNNSGEDIPQFACMFITGSQTEGHDSALLATKPDANAIKYDYSRFAFNVGKVVPAGGYGDAQLWYPALAAIDGTVALATAVGPVAGSWYLGTSTYNKFWRVSNQDPVGAYVSGSVRTWFVSPVGQFYDIHFQYQLLTNWFGGIALARLKDMDGIDMGAIVIVRDPLAIFAYQHAGDKGYMVYQPHKDKYYAIQAPCGTTPVVQTTGACCFQSGSEWDCFDATSADCSDFGGIWAGAGTKCESTECPP